MENRLIYKTFNIKVDELNKRKFLKEYWYNKKKFLERFNIF